MSVDIASNMVHFGVRRNKDLQVTRSPLIRRIIRTALHYICVEATGKKVRPELMRTPTISEKLRRAMLCLEVKFEYNSIPKSK